MSKRKYSGSTKIACTVKRAHPDWMSAFWHCVHLERDTGGRKYNVYHCEHCDMYHVTRSRSPSKRRKQYLPKLQKELGKMALYIHSDGFKTKAPLVVQQRMLEKFRVFNELHDFLTYEGE
jgi:hypothetical protein